MLLRYALTYVLTLVIFGAIDAVWLSMAASIYRNTLGAILLDSFRPWPAVVFYLLNILGLMIFAVRMDGAGMRWEHALLYGALYGIFTYATYDLTNYATLRAWTLSLTLMDIGWGAFVSGVSTALGVAAAGAILRRFG